MVPVVIVGNYRPLAAFFCKVVTLLQGMTMSSNDLDVSNGPDKSDLLRAVANPEKHLHVSFDTAAGPVEAHIDAIEEGGDDGLTFALRGHLTSGNLRGAVFAGRYDSTSRTGRLVLRRA